MGYSYDYSHGSFRNQLGRSHEIVIEFDLNVSRKSQFHYNFVLKFICINNWAGSQVNPPNRTKNVVFEVMKVYRLNSQYVEFSHRKQKLFGSYAVIPQLYETDLVNGNWTKMKKLPFVKDNAIYVQPSISKDGKHHIMFQMSLEAKEVKICLLLNGKIKIGHNQKH